MTTMYTVKLWNSDFITGKPDTIVNVKLLLEPENRNSEYIAQLAFCVPAPPCHCPEDNSLSIGKFSADTEQAYLPPALLSPPSPSMETWDLSRSQNGLSIFPHQWPRYGGPDVSVWLLKFQFFNGLALCPKTAGRPTPGMQGKVL